MKLISKLLQAAGIFLLKLCVYLFYTLMWSISLLRLEYDAYIRNFSLITIILILFSIVMTWLLEPVYFSKEYLLKEEHKNTAMSYSFLSHILISIAVVFFIYWDTPYLIKVYEGFGPALPEVTAVFFQFYKYVVILPLASSAAYIFLLKSRTLSDKTEFIMNISDFLLILANIVLIFAIVARYAPVFRIS